MGLKVNGEPFPAVAEADYEGAYAAGTTYGLGAVVTSAGSSYISLQAGNVGHAPASSPTWWGVLASAGAAGAAGAPGPAPAGTGIVTVTGGVLDVPSVTTASLVSMHGFVLTALGAQQSTLSYNVGTRELTLTPTGTTTPVYVNGTLYNLPATTKQHTAAEGAHFFYLDSAGAMQVSVGFPVLEPWLSFSLVACVLYSTSGAAAQGLLLDERHTSPRDVSFHRWAHSAIGTRVISDCLIDGTTYQLNSATDAHVTPGWNGGTIADEDLRTTISAKPQGSYLIFRRTATFWRWDTASFPFPDSGGYPAWDNAGTLTALSGSGGGEWANMWAMLVPAIVGSEQLVIIPGHAKHTSLASALAESESSLYAANLPFVELVPHYQLTFHARSSYGGTYKTQLQGVTRLAGNRNIVTSGGTATAASIPYTPPDATLWRNAVPTNVAGALNDLVSGGFRRKVCSPSDLTQETGGDGATVTTVGSTTQIVIPAAKVMSWLSSGNGPRLLRALASPRSSAVRFRFSVAAGSVDTRVGIALARIVGGVVSRASGVHVGPSDTYAGDLVGGGAWGDSTLAALPVDGTALLELRHGQAGWAAYYAITATSTTAPTEADWVLIGRIGLTDVALGSAPLTHLGIYVDQLFGLGAPATVTISDVSADALAEVP